MIFDDRFHSLRHKETHLRLRLRLSTITAIEKLRVAVRTEAKVLEGNLRLSTEQGNNLSEPVLYA